MRTLLVMALLLLTVWGARAQYDIDRFFNRGQMAMMEGQYTRAINNFNIIIRLDGDLYEAWFFRGIANYGVRPTVERDGVPAPLLETHLPDVPDGVPAPTYGDFIRVEWLRFVRPETRFDGIGALKAQLEKDKLAALDFSEETYSAGV